MGELNALVLNLVFAAIFFYVLYGVIRAGVRDGILAADRRRARDASEAPETPGTAPGPRP
jgi:hypothetical protein